METPILLDFAQLATEGKLTLPPFPVSGKQFDMKMASGRTQLIAQRIYDPATKSFEFMMENIRQCLIPMPPMDDMLDLPNPDLDFVQSVYSRLNRTGKHAITESELDEFFKNQSPSKS
jgi:hypothetical protein